MCQCIKVHWHFLFEPFPVIPIMLKESCFKIGFIQRTHGLKGELTVVMEEELPEAGFDAVFVDQDNRLIPFFIRTISRQGTKALMRFEDVDTIEHAKPLIGKSLYLPKSLRPRLGRGEFYDDEIVGFTVTERTLGDLGTVREMVDAGPNKLMSIDYNQKEVLIPVNGPFIKSINKTKKTIAVELPDGFVDLNS